MTKTVITKTVEETRIDKGTFVMYQRRKEGVRCGCFHDEPDPNRICRECYGVGLDGGYYDACPAQFRDAVYEEVQKSTVTVGNTTTTSEVFPVDNDWNTLAFECSFEMHIYYQCLIELDMRWWSVVEVEQVPDDEDDDGLPLPDRWRVTARKLLEFEPGYAFMEDHREDTNKARNDESFNTVRRLFKNPPQEVDGPMFLHPDVLKKGKLLALCPKCGHDMHVETPDNLDEEFDDELVCEKCEYKWKLGEE